MVKINKRSEKIFNILKSNPGGTTISYLSRQLGVSSRTIRSDMKLLQEALNCYGVEITSNPSKCYKISNLKKISSIEHTLFQENDSSMESSQQRVNYIICRLLENSFSDASVTQADLADEMFISLSTLKSHLNEAKADLKKYDLKIVQYKNKGIKIIGSEIKLRYCISEYMNVYTMNTFYQKIFSDVNLIILDRIIRKILQEKNLQLTDDAKENLCIHTAIAVQRFKCNKNISYPASVTNRIEKTFEYTVGKEIVEQIYVQLGIDLSCAEVYYITQCLLASKKIFDTGEATDNAHVKELVNIILQEIRDNLSIDFTNDEYLLDGLTLHLNIALTRIQFQMNIRNELLETIKNDYPLAFQMGVIAGNVVQKYDNIKINENEIGYIALHFGAAISRKGIKETVKSKKIIIVCSSGLGMSVLLKTKIEEHFHKRLDIVKLLPGYEVTDSIVDKVDFVLTTVPLKNIDSSKVIKINHILRPDDFETIENRIFKENFIDKEEMKKFFDESNFYIDKDFNTKEECIEFLTSEAVSKNMLTEKAKQSVFEREEMSSTEIGHLAAIPHTLYNEQGKSFISILVLNKPILWNEFFVQVVFLMNVNKNKVNLWKPMFLNLFNYIKKKKGIDSLLKNRSYSLFIKEFIDTFD